MRKQYAPPTNEVEVASFEGLVGERLPEDYRSFLLKDNGGVPESPRFCFLGTEGSYAGSVIRYFLSISDDRNISLLHHYEIYVRAGRVPENVLPIAVDPGGNLLVLGLDGHDRGKVYFWDHEVEGLKENPSAMEHLKLVATSFSDLFDRLLPERHSGK